MKRVQAKLQNQRGETLVELLAAILVCALSVGLLMGGIAVSNRLLSQARAADADFSAALTAAESRQTPITAGIAGSPSVAITSGTTEITIPVGVYGDETLYSYSRAAGDGGS